MNMPTFFCCLVLAGAIPVHLTAEEPVELLLQEIRRTVEERDSARKELLKTQSDSDEALETLHREKQGLSQALEQKSNQILELEAAVSQSALAAERAREELQAKNRAIAEMEADQVWMQRKYDQVLEQVQTLSSSASAEELRTLRAQQTQLQRRLQTANQQLLELRGGRGIAAGEQQALEKMNQELTNSLNQARRAEALSNAKLAALENRLTTLRNELSLQFEERSRLEQEKEQMEQTIGQLQSDLDQALQNRVPREEVDELQSRLNQALEENRQMQDELAARREIPDLREDFALVKRERDLLSAQKKTLDRKLKRAQSSLMDEQENRQELSQQNRDLKELLRGERKRAKELEKDIRSLKAGVQAAENAGIDAKALVSVRRLLEDMKQENRDLKTLVKSQKNTVDSLMQELTEEENKRNLKVRELQGMLGQQLNELAEAQKQLKKLEYTENELDFVREQRETLIQRQHASRRDMKTLAKHIYELREKVKRGEVAEADLVREQQRSRGLSSTIRNLRRELTNLERMQKVVSTEKLERDREIRNLRQQLRKEEAQRSALQAEKQALERRLDALNTGSRAP